MSTQVTSKKPNKPLKKVPHKITGFFNSTLRIFAAILVAVTVIGYSIGAQFFWHKNGVLRKIICDNGSELVDPNTAINSYLSPLFTSTINKQLTNPTTMIRLQTQDPLTGSLNAITNDDPSIITTTNDDPSGHTVYTSSKTTASDQPLGWEADLEQTTSGHIDDYGISLSYKSTVTVEVGVTYRKDGDVISSSVYSKLPKTTDYSPQVLHFASYPPNTHPYITFSSNDVGQLSVKDVVVGLLPAKQLKSGMVSVAFDDGWQSVYTYGVPLFAKYGVATTQFVVSDFSLQKPYYPEYMTYDQLVKMQSQGHEIASHSFEHCDATVQTDMVLKDSVKKSQAQFNKSFGTSPKLYAHPFGAYDNHVNSVVSAGFAYIRSSDVGFNSAYYDPHNIKIQPVLSTTTTDQVKDWAKTAADQHVWLVLLYHRINEPGDYSVTSAQLQDQLKVLEAQTGIQIMPMSQAINTINAAN
jgi:peptidoglycan/xylan/chitin deacetylase (PgdA/CDA1 family)